MMDSVSESSIPSWLTVWCAEHLGATPTRLLPVPKPASMSEVFGVLLGDGRSVAVKARPDEAGRAASCVAAQGVLAEGGFACAAPVTLVTLHQGTAIHAEEWRPGGHILAGDGPQVAEAFARVLARLDAQLEPIRVAPPTPNPRWVRWDHRDAGTWPAASFLDGRDASRVAPFIEETARRATARLLAADLPCGLGHADWETQNLRWHGTTIWAVHDWDSLAWLPEAAIVGAASGSFASNETPTLAPLRSSEAFLEAYQHERGRRFTSSELEVAWAASLWPAAHNARSQALFQRPPIAETALREQAELRLALAGA
jgi:hypothetical protein